MEKRHPFSFTLGPGPYRYVRLVQIKKSETSGVAVLGRTDDVERGIGTCAHCGHSIVDCYIVQTGEGKKFGVGSDCIFKVYQEGDFSNISELERRIRQEKRRKGQERREKQRVALREECLNIVKDNLDKFALSPHPNRIHAEKGKTMKDYVLWYIAGDSTLGGWKLFKKKITEALAELKEEGKI